MRSRVFACLLKGPICVPCVCCVANRLHLRPCSAPSVHQSSPLIPPHSLIGSTSTWTRLHKGVHQAFRPPRHQHPDVPPAQHPPVSHRPTTVPAQRPYRPIRRIPHSYESRRKAVWRRRRTPSHPPHLNATLGHRNLSPLISLRRSPSLHPAMSATLRRAVSSLKRRIRSGVLILSTPSCVFFWPTTSLSATSLQYSSTRRDSISRPTPPRNSAGS